ncbi:uncharacterized protein LOC108236637 isoform X2 [Kryptolebias marmoratus]|uniref:uncharacterized protein LOC108236637 isoform X2 n=1 Tax=Kryptolebias marmoratus TaxID=37003 RepID=UPI0018ACAB20|nr:uncharacterized protein LOC108236637 isoform X2 [Kryptolebias marmoratus]
MLRLICVQFDHNYQMMSVIRTTMIVFYVAFVFTAVQCTKDQNFSTKTVDVGEDVTLTCSRRSNKSGSLFWIKLVPGNLPEVLGATYTFNHSIVKETLHFKLNHGPETFVLQIYQIKLSDTAFYYCEEVIDLQKTVLNVTFISVKGPEPEIKAIVSEFPSVAVRPGDSVTLQCSVLSESDNQMCPDNSSVHWFRAGSTETRPNLIYVRGNGGEKCERSPEAHDLQKCVYNFSWSQISSSDVGTYYCAVVTCGQILFGKGTKLEMEAPWSFSDSWAPIILLSLSCAALVISLTVIVLLVHKIKKLKCNINAAAVDAGTTAVQQSQSTPEDTLVYSVPNFTKKKSGQRAKRSLNTTEQQSIYSDIWASGNE